MLDSYHGKNSMTRWVGALRERRIHDARRSNVPVFSCGRIREDGWCQLATSEPVVHHHGREGGRRRSQQGAAVSFNSLLGGPPSQPAKYGLLRKSSAC